MSKDGVIRKKDNKTIEMHKNDVILHQRKDIIMSLRILVK